MCCRFVVKLFCCFVFVVKHLLFSGGGRTVIGGGGGADYVYVYVRDCL